MTTHCHLCVAFSGSEAHWSQPVSRPVVLIFTTCVARPRTVAGSLRLLDQRSSHCAYSCVTTSRACYREARHPCVFFHSFAFPVTFKQWRLQNRPQHSLVFCLFSRCAVSARRRSALGVCEGKQDVHPCCGLSFPINLPAHSTRYLTRLRAHARAWLKIHFLAVFVLAQVRPLRSAGLVYSGAVCSG